MAFGKTARTVGHTALSLGLALGAASAHAQTLPQNSEEALHQMTLLAGVIFTGQVVAIRQHAPAGGGSGFVEIEFAVDEQVRGVSASTYTLREWAGLWPGGDEPFRVGQRYLMLLHTPSASGLSSPVSGMDGAIPIRGVGQAASPDTSITARPQVLTAGSATGAPVDSDGQTGLQIDLRWIGTHVLTPTAYVPEPSNGPVARPIQVHADAINAFPSNPVAARPIQPIEKVSHSASPVAEYATVLGLLRSWEKNDQVAR